MKYSDIYLKYMYPVVMAFVFLGLAITISWSGNPSAWIWGSVAVFFILTMFSKTRYVKILSPPILICLIIFSGLILGFTFLVQSIYVSTYQYYIAIGIFLFYIVILVYGYRRQWKGF